MRQAIFFTFMTIVFLVSISSGFAAECLVIPTGKSAPILKIDGDTDRISWEADDTLVFDAPVGDRALFAFPLPDGAKFDDYGLCKFEVKIEGGPSEVKLHVERPGSHIRIWRPVDIHRPPDGWYTAHVDLAQPEIVMDLFHGDSVFKAQSPRLAFSLWSFDSGYAEMAKRRKISIRNVRLVKRHLDVRWNGTDFRVVPDASGDLVYEYPIVICNRDAVSRTIEARIERTEGQYGSARIIPREAVVGAADSARFTATLRLPKNVAVSLPVFSCEWFQPVFSVRGIADSDEGILRSCKRIPLPIMIMPEERGVDAVFGQNIVENIRHRHSFTDGGKKEGDSLIAQAKGIVAGNLTIPDGPGFAAAYYFCVEHRCGLQYQGPGKHYCPVGKEYLTKDFAGVSLDRDYATSRHESFGRNVRILALAYVLTGDTQFSKAALHILEQYRAKYFTWDWMDLDTSRDTIDKGRMEFAKYMEGYPFRAMVEGLEFLRATGGVDAGQAARLERELLLPALSEMADFRMDMICRETSIVIAALTGALAYGNAPLTAFCIDSPFGYWSLRRYGATGDGLVFGHGYGQNHFAKNLFDMAEMMYHNGRDTFDPELKRLADCSFWWSSPMNPRAAADICAIAARHYPDPVYKAYALRTLLGGEPPALYGSAPDLSAPPSVNFPGSGLTILRRPDPAGTGTLDAEFKWGIPDNRGSFSVLSLGLSFRGYRAQSYPGHFPWGSTDLHHNWQIQSASHTTLVVDSHNQSGMKDYFKGHYQPHASEQVCYEEGEHATVTLAYNNRIYPGVDIWRAVCVLDGVYLVADILRSDKAHTYDWWFHGVPDKSDGLTGIQAALRPRPEPLGKEDGYQMVRNLSSARVAGNLNADWTIPKEGSRGEYVLSLRAVNEKPLEAVHGFEWSRQFSGPEKEFLVLRREGAKNADFIVLLQPRGKGDTPAIAERFAVTDGKGRTIDNVLGIRIMSGGKRFEVIINPNGVEVKTAVGSTKKRISVTGGD
jgi:hypothetical protein